MIFALLAIVLLVLVALFLIGRTSKRNMLEEQAKRIFALIDTEKRGKIGKEDLSKFLKERSKLAWERNALVVSDKDLELFFIIDKTDSNFVTEQEFIEWWKEVVEMKKANLKGDYVEKIAKDICESLKQNESLSAEKLTVLFDSFDVKKQGRLERGEFKCLMEKLCESLNYPLFLNEKEFDHLFHSIDTDHKGEVSRERFVKWFQINRLLARRTLFSHIEKKFSERAHVVRSILDLKHI